MRSQGRHGGGEACVGDGRIKEIEKERKNEIAERHKGRNEGRQNTIGRKKERKTNIKQETKQFPRERKEERNEGRRNERTRKKEGRADRNNERTNK